MRGINRVNSRGGGAGGICQCVAYTTPTRDMHTHFHCSPAHGSTTRSYNPVLRTQCSQLRQRQLLHIQCVLVNNEILKKLLSGEKQNKTNNSSHILPQTRNPVLPAIIICYACFYSCLTHTTSVYTANIMI